MLTRGSQIEDADDEARLLHAVVEGLRRQSTGDRAELTAERAHDLVERRLRRRQAAYAPGGLPTRP